jgi:hypothetical protein
LEYWESLLLGLTHYNNTGRPPSRPGPPAFSLQRPRTCLALFMISPPQPHCCRRTTAHRYARPWLTTHFFCHRPYPLREHDEKAKFHFTSLLPPPSPHFPPHLCHVLPSLSATPSLCAGHHHAKALLAIASCAAEPHRASGNSST